MRRHSVMLQACNVADKNYHHYRINDHEVWKVLRKVLYLTKQRCCNSRNKVAIDVYAEEKTKVLWQKLRVSIFVFIYQFLCPLCTQCMGTFAIHQISKENLLKIEQKLHCDHIVMDLLALMRLGSTSLHLRLADRDVPFGFITTDETWIHSFTPEIN